MNRAAIARANLRELNKRGKSCRIRPTAEPSRSNLDKFGTCVLDVSCTVVIKYTTRHAKILCHKLGKNYLTNISPTLSCIQFHTSSKIEIMWHTQNFTKRLVQSKSPLSLLIHPPPGRHRLGTVSWMEPWVIRMMWCQHMSCWTNTSTCDMKRISCEMLSVKAAVCQQDLALPTTYVSKKFTRHVAQKANRHFFNFCPKMSCHVFLSKPKKHPLLCSICKHLPFSIVSSGFDLPFFMTRR